MVSVMVWLLFQVTEIRLKYFDTVPVASSMCVLKSGFLFIAAEFGNQLVHLSLSNTGLFAVHLSPFVISVLCWKKKTEFGSVVEVCMLCVF